MVNQREIPRHREFLAGAAERGAENGQHPVGHEKPGKEGELALLRAYRECDSF